MPEGKVRMISGSSGTADGSRAALPRAQSVLDMFRAADLCFLTMVGWENQGESVPTGRRSRKANGIAEYARSNYDGNLTDSYGSVSDHAFDLGGTVTLGILYLGARYKYIGKDFNSIGYQYFTNDRKGYEALAGLTYKSFSLSGTYNIQQDNVRNDPQKDTSKFYDGMINLSLSVADNISFNVGYKSNRQSTFRDNVRACPKVT
jgi:hypothetical protein